MSHEKKAMEGGSCTCTCFSNDDSVCCDLVLTIKSKSPDKHHIETASLEIKTVELTLPKLQVEFDRDLGRTGVEKMEFMGDYNPDVHSLSSADGDVEEFLVIGSRNSSDAYKEDFELYMFDSQTGESLGLKKSVKLAVEMAIYEAAFSLDFAELGVKRMRGERNYAGETLLYYATRKQYWPVVAFLIAETDADVTECVLSERDADVHVNPEDEDEEDPYSTPLLLAIKNNHKKVVRYMLEHSAADVVDKQQGVQGEIPVIAAILSGHEDLSHWLIHAKHANPHNKNEDGETPLMWAANKGFLGLVKELVEQYHADVNVHDMDGWTCVMLAAGKGQLDVVRYLVKDAHADVNHRNEEGFTPIMLSAEEGRLEVVKYLVLDAKANVNVTALDGTTALIVAAEYGHVEVVKLLIEKGGANTNMQDSLGDTAFHKAAYKGPLALVQLLAQHTNVLLKNNQGMYPYEVDASPDRDIDTTSYMMKLSLDPVYPKRWFLGRKMKDWELQGHYVTLLKPPSKQIAYL